MKYDRPVHELLDECAQSLHAPFTRADILQWFHDHYPDIRPHTISTHIFGLTEGDAPSKDQYQFAGRRPVLRRVGRGMYARAGGGPGSTASRALQAPAAPPASPAVPPPPTADVVLVGCAKSKRPTPAPARDLYTSALFARRRRYAEATGLPWFVLSSRWGLVAPDEVIAPYDLYLGDLPSSYRRAWGAMVTAQLSLRGPVRGTVFEVHAGDHYVTALRPACPPGSGTTSGPASSTPGRRARHDGRAASGRPTRSDFGSWACTWAVVRGCRPSARPSPPPSCRCGARRRSTRIG